SADRLGKNRKVIIRAALLPKRGKPRPQRKRFFAVSLSAIQRQQALNLLHVSNKKGLRSQTAQFAATAGRSARMKKTLRNGPVMNRCAECVTLMLHKSLANRTLSSIRLLGVTNRY